MESWAEIGNSVADDSGDSAAREGISEIPGTEKVRLSIPRLFGSAFREMLLLSEK